MLIESRFYQDSALLWAGKRWGHERDGIIVLSRRGAHEENSKRKLLREDGDLRVIGNGIIIIIMHTLQHLYLKKNTKYMLCPTFCSLFLSPNFQGDLRFFFLLCCLSF